MIDDVRYEYLRQLMETMATKGSRSSNVILLYPKGSLMTTSYRFNLLNQAGALHP